MKFDNRIYYKLFGEGKYVFLGTLVEKLTFFLVFVYLARLESKESYGLVVTAFAFSNIMYSLFDAGLPAYFQRESASERKSIGLDLSYFTTLKLLAAPVFLILILPFFYNYLNSYAYIIVAIGMFVYMSGFGNLFNSILQGRGQYKESFVSLFSARIVLLVLFMAIIFFGYSLLYALLPLLISSIIYLIMMTKHLKRNTIKLGFYKIDKKKVKLILSSSLPIGAGIIFVWIYDRADIIIIQKMIGPKAVADYAIAYSIYKISQMVSGAILVPSYTRLSKNFAREKILRLNELIPVGVMLLTAAFIFITSFFLFGNVLIDLIYGTKYAGSAAYLKIIGLAVPWLFLNNFTGIISNSVRKEKIPVIGTGLGGVLFIAINLSLIPIFGIWGAVYSTIAAEFTVFIIQLYLLLRMNRRSLLIEFKA